MKENVYLKELQQKVERKKEFIHILEELYVQKEALTIDVKKLEQKKQQEQKDVERLEKKGLTSLFYSVVGMKETKLEKERMEAKEASVQYERVLREFEHIKESIQINETELEKIEKLEIELKEQLEKKKEKIKSTKTLEMEKLLSMENQIIEFEKEQQIFIETKNIISKIEKNVETIKISLEKAEEAAVKESFSSFMEVEKYEQLSKAQKQATSLKQQLEALQSNIKQIAEKEYDINVFYELANGLSAFQMQADIAMEVAVIERIRGAKGVVKQIEKEMKYHLEQLEIREKQNKIDLEMLKQQLENFVIDVVIV